MNTFWQSIKNKKSPFFALAPMEDVTDTVFRRVVASVAAPDVFFTEFTSVEGLLSLGGRTVGRRLEYTEKERPLIAQIWGLQPENFYKAAKQIVAQGFDGIDINMGCPSKEVTKIGACSALIKNPNLAKEIIEAVKEGAGKKVSKVSEVSEVSKAEPQTPHPHPLPKERELEKSIESVPSPEGEGQDEGSLAVSVKTRIGYNSIATEEWIGFLLEQGIDALTVHGRTVKEMSKVPAHWDEIGKVVALKNQMGKETVILGNGDVKTLAEGKTKAEETGVDGIMIGRGIFENIWVFSSKGGFVPTIKERVGILLRHLDLYENQHGEKHAFQTLKKFFKIYIRDFDGAGELRMRLMEARNVEEVKQIINDM
jgi:tRNA-dihydrouridine synthase